ncbi:hypothetical protein C9374_006633 [Naegleria lovaniensis]|uniref:Uncharacterized protein n=1 Tax=Naegleria lovaniensis TaxID=51637 RepID=A0AA88GLU9_NAELO|nr:uncharacterized protein C9374_006633 [Naegleria lovaniensis]KAG2379516.1 hypothetical protein C9374_006633 [Naegleria lovaniensis]
MQRTASAILERRAQRLARRWKKHENAIYDIFTVALAFLDVQDQFMNLVLVNKWFYDYIHECMKMIQVVEYPFENQRPLNGFLYKLYLVKNGSHLQFQDIEPGEEDEEMNEIDHQMNHQLNITTTTIPPPPTSQPQIYILERLFYPMPGVYDPNDTLPQLLKEVPKFKIREVVLYTHYGKKYGFQIPKVCNYIGKNIERFLFLDCAQVQNDFVMVKPNLVQNCITINTVFIGNEPLIDTRKMDIDSVLYMMETYQLFSLSPLNFQFSTKEIKEYIAFDSHGSVQTSNNLWKAITKHPKLYPYLQNVFHTLGLYYFESIYSELSNIVETNFRVFCDKWTQKTQIRKNRIQFIISSVIRQEKTISDFVTIATKIDEYLEKRKRSAVEKVKLENLAHWIKQHALHVKFTLNSIPGHLFL